MTLLVLGRVKVWKSCFSDLQWNARLWWTENKNQVQLVLTILNLFVLKSVNLLRMAEQEATTNRASFEDLFYFSHSWALKLLMLKSGLSTGHRPKIIQYFHGDWRTFSMVQETWTLNYLLLYLEWTVGYLHSWRTLFWVLHPPQMVKSFMKLGVKFYSFSREKGWNFFPFHRDSRLSLVTVISVRWKYFGQGGEKTMLGICFWKQLR